MKNLLILFVLPWPWAALMAPPQMEWPPLYPIEGAPAPPHKV